jgi:hypothetical protein
VFSNKDFALVFWPLKRWKLRYETMATPADSTAAIVKQRNHLHHGIFHAIMKWKILVVEDERNLRRLYTF